MTATFVRTPIPRIVWVAFWALLGLGMLSTLSFWPEGVSARAVVGAIAAIGVTAALCLATILGHQWARVLQTIGAAIVLLGAVAAIIGVAGQDAAYLVPGVISALPVVLLWFPRSNRYFRDVSADRRARMAVSTTLGLRKPARLS